MKKVRSKSGTYRVAVGKDNYDVPGETYMKLKTELEPHRVYDESNLTFDDFFQVEKRDLPEWASLLRGLRYREALTQKEFAKAISIPQSNLSAMETGKRPIGKELAKRIAETFHTDYRYFL